MREKSKRPEYFLQYSMEIQSITLEIVVIVARWRMSVCMRVDFIESMRMRKCFRPILQNHQMCGLHTGGMCLAMHSNSIIIAIIIVFNTRKPNVQYLQQFNCDSFLHLHNR